MKVKTAIENGFSETEMGLIPSDWNVVDLGNKEYFEVLNSGIDKFKNSKGYLSTSSIEWNKIIDIECDITYNNRPSRANMQPRLDTVWFAKMKNTVKVYDFTKENQVEVEKYILSTGFTGLLCNRSKAYPKYIGKIFLSPWFNQIKDNLAHGSTQKAVNNQDIKKILIPLPSFLEQQKISFVLSKIQQAIEQQDKIIQTIKELKKSLMNKLFTVGLYGEEHKETDIGLMPKSWGIVKLGDIATISTGTTPSTMNNKYYEGNIPFIRTSEIDNNIINAAQIFISDKAVKDYNLKIYSPGTIFLAMYGQGKTRGRASLLNIHATTSQNTAAILPNTNKLSSLYLWQYLKNNYEKLRSFGIQGHISHLNLGYVKNLTISLPSFSEQKEIANILSNIDIKIQQVESRKQTLQALFKTMLNQLMTGRIRVKNLDIEVN